MRHIREIAKEILNKVGHESPSENQIREVESCIKDTYYDIIMFSLDVKETSLNTEDALERVRQMGPAEGVPVYPFNQHFKEYPIK